MRKKGRKYTNKAHRARVRAKIRKESKSLNSLGIQRGIDQFVENKSNDSFKESQD